MAIDFIITDAGRAAVLNSHQNGWGPVEITEIALGSGSWTPTPSATALQSEIKRLTAIAGGASSPTTLHVNGADRSSDDYEAFEAGLYLSSGVLFAIVSQPIAIVSKSASSSAYVSADIEMTGQVTPAMVTFGDTNFVWNSATETVEGLVELATSTEVQDATGNGVVTAAQTASFARAGESADGHTASGLKSGIYTSSASGFDGQFAVRATKPSGKSLALVVTEGTSDGELAISVQDTPSGAWTEKYVFRDNDSNDARYLQTGNNLSDLASATDARTNLGLAYATQVQAQDGVNNATAMTPLRTADAITAQRPYASQAQAQAGTDNATVMTPLRTKAAIDAKRATETEARVGTNNTTIMTPLRVRQQIERNVTLMNGGVGGTYFVEYSGGLGVIILDEWGTASVPAGGSLLVSTRATTYYGKLPGNIQLTQFQTSASSYLSFSYAGTDGFTIYAKDLSGAAASAEVHWRCITRITT